MKNIIYVLTIFLLVSCQQKTELKSSIYSYEVLSVSPHKVTKSLGVSDYFVDSISFLKMPDREFLSNVDKMFLGKDLILLLDKDQSKKVWAFAKDGSYKYKIGDIGKSMSEFIEGPTDFDVNRSEGKIFAYDRWKNSLLKFSLGGKFEDKIDLDNILPTSFAIENNGNFLFSMKEYSSGNDVSELIVSSPKMERIYNLKQLEQECLYLPSNSQFSKSNNALYYIPILADSVYRISNDTIDRLIKVDFGNRFISAKEKSEMLALKHPKLGKKVKQINDYQENENWTYLSYVYDDMVYYFLKNKSSNKVINSPILMEGLYSPNKVILQNDQLICFLSDDFVPMAIKSKDSMGTNWDKMLDLTCFQIRQMIDKKEKGPVVIYFHLRQ